MGLHRWQPGKLNRQTGSEAGFAFTSEVFAESSDNGGGREVR